MQKKKNHTPNRGVEINTGKGKGKGAGIKQGKEWEAGRADRWVVGI